MKKFSPDSRNFGGRKVISDNFRIHYENLASAKPVLQTRSSTRNGISTSNCSFSKYLLKRTNESFHASKGHMNVLNEHLLNIKHMNRRIHSLGSYNERKKNPFDPITHPVVFFRGGDDTKELILGHKFISRSVRPPKRINAYSTGEVKESREGKRPATSVEVKVQVPVVESGEFNPGKKLKRLLFETIVRNRIFREADLQELFQCTREANGHLRQDVVEGAISLIYKDLNS